MKNRLISFIVIVIFFFSTFLGCSGSDKNQQISDRQNKNELVVSFASEPEKGFDTVISGHGSMTRLFFSTLFKRDKNLGITTDLATGYSISKDRLKWTVTIRKDVLFADSTKLTAIDVAFTYKKAKESGGEVDLTMLDSVKAIDDYTIEFTLGKPQSIFIEKMASIGIVPKDAYSENFSNNPIGSGPYKLIQWDKGQQVIAGVNEYYYGEKPSIQKLTMVFLSEDAAYAAVKAGKVDLAAIPASMAKESVDGKKIISLDSIETYGVSYPMVKSGGKNGEGNPIGNDVTSDRAIRRSLTVSINRKEIVDGIFEGFGTTSTTGLEKMPWLNIDTILKSDGDKDDGKRILNDAGWIDTDNDGIREKNGIKAEFKLIYTEGMYRQDLALAFQKAAKDIGIKVDVESRNWDTIIPEINSSAILYGWGSGDPSEIHSLYSSKVERENVPWNNSGYYNNQKVDEYIDYALASEDENVAIGFWKNAQWDGNTGFSSNGDCTYTWLANAGHIYIMDSKLNIGKPAVQPHGGRLLDNITEWKWDNL